MRIEVIFKNAESKKKTILSTIAEVPRYGWTWAQDDDG
jgi:hypothetical protein